MSPSRQQINLYQEAAPSWRPFGSATLALAAATVSFSLALIWGFGTWQVDRLQRSVDALQRQQDEQQAALSALGSLSAGTHPADLQSRIQELSAELAAREHALALLQGGTAGSTNGFSPRLAALARHPMPGLWLQRVTLSDLTGSMSLAGEVTSPEKVPRYLHALATEPALAGMRFDGLAIERQPTTHAASGPTRSLHEAAAFHFRADGAADSPVQLAATQGPPP